MKVAVNGLYSVAQFHQHQEQTDAVGSPAEGYQIAFAGIEQLLLADVSGYGFNERQGGGVLFYVEHQPLQVFTLGMVDVDGVIGGLVQLVEYAHLALGLCRSGENGIAEMVLADYL